MNTITKILSKDSCNGYAVLTYIDLHIEYTKEQLEGHLKTVVDSFPILKSQIDATNTIIPVTTFDISNHYTIIYDSADTFNTTMDVFLNAAFTTQSHWAVHYLVDKEQKRYRLVFKIDHAYADGYKIIEMLTSIIDKKDTNTLFKHTSRGVFNTLYYATIGTLLLLIQTCGIWMTILSATPVPPNHAPTSHICCKPLSLAAIRVFTKEHSVTVNDFLYSLMIKTDSIYTGKVRTLITASPINISGGTQLNNMMPIFNTLANDMPIPDLFKSVHATFNNYKYSFYIPFLSVIIKLVGIILPMEVLQQVYSKVIYKCDYTYSNIIGPQIDIVKDIHFVTLAKDKEIVFNIISSNDNVNIICSYKEGVLPDPDRFEKAIYKAYDAIIQGN